MSKIKIISSIIFASCIAQAGATEIQQVPLEIRTVTSNPAQHLGIEVWMQWWDGLHNIAIEANKATAEEIQAPLGLNWGASVETLTVVNGAKNIGRTDERTELYELKKTPITLTDFDNTIALVDKKYGLVKIVMIKNFNGDLLGSDGVKFYNKYKKTLSKKYGSGSSYEYMGRKLYDNSDEFYQCLAYSGCGSYMTTFEPNKNQFIAVRLSGTSRGKGQLIIGYESSKFYTAEDERNAVNDESAEKGL